MKQTEEQKSFLNTMSGGLYESNDLKENDEAAEAAEQHNTEPYIKQVMNVVPNERHEFFLFVFLRGNSFAGYKLNPDGTIIYSLKTHSNGQEYAAKEEKNIEMKGYNDDVADPYELLYATFQNGDVLRISSYVDDKGVFHKEISKVMDKKFCLNTQKSWNEIKHHWFRPEEASLRLEEHINSL